MKIVVIADDLTGANAAGVLFAKQGFSTATMVQGISCPPSSQYDTVCIDTDSRYLSPNEAEKRVAKVTTSMHQQGAELFCKRIDSTVRGNIGAEIDAILNTLDKNTVAIVQASFPTSKRTMIGGYLLVNGVPVQETDVALDPLMPLNQSFVPQIIKQQSKLDVRQIELDTVQQGQAALARQLLAKIQAGGRIVVVDAVSDEHIETLAKAMSSIEHSFVTADPGPLSAAYARIRFGKSTQGPKVLAVVGSVTSLTMRQVNHLINKFDIKPVYVNPEALISREKRPAQAIADAVKQSIEYMQTQQVILVTTCQSENTLLDLVTLAKEEGTHKTTLAKRLTDNLALISQGILEQQRSMIGSYFSSGGDVTASLCAVSNVKGIELIDEVQPLAAYGRFIGGDLDNFPVVTKGGLVGDECAISTCIQFLLTKTSRVYE